MILIFFSIFINQNGLGSLQGNEFIKFFLIIVLFINSFRKAYLINIFKNIPKIFFIFFIFLIFHSLLISRNTLFSIQSSLVFFLMIVITFNSFINIDENKKEIFEKDILTLYEVILILSLFSLFDYSMSYKVNGFAFQGITNHPNVYGIYMATYSAFLIGKLLKKYSFRNFIFLCLSIFTVVLSLSRTSLFSIILAFVTYYIINNDFKKLLGFKPFFIVTILTILSFFYVDNIYNAINNTLTKNKDSISFLESIESSRGELYKSQFNNIKDYPLGIGFKIPSIYENGNEEILTAYEKGNNITASIEEIGLIGTILFFVFILMIIKKGMTKFNPYAMVIICALFTTMGESTLFSIGGFGIYIWLLLFYFSFTNSNVS